MKKLLFLLVLLVVSNTLLCQIADIPVKYYSKTFSDSFDNIVVNKKLFFNKHFITLFGINNEAPGNVLTIDSKEATLDFKGSIILGKFGILNLGLKSGVQNGVSAIFTDSKLNRKVGGDIGLIIELSKNKNNTLFYDNYLSQLSKYETYIGQSKQIMKSIEDKRKEIAGSNDKLVKEVENKIISQEKKNSMLDSLQSIFIQRSSWLDELESKNKYKSDSIELLVYSGLRFQAYNTSWLSANLGFQNRVFRTYDIAKTYDDQVFKSDYTNVELRFNWNHLHKSELDFSYYIQAGITVFEKDNLSDLDEISVTNRETSATETSTRIFEEKYAAYKGLYKKGLAGLSFNSDFYPFIKRDPKNLLHIGFEYATNEKQADIQNVIFGYVKGFKTAAGLFNIEFYYQFRDILNNRASDLSFWQRNEIGLKTSFPLTFNNK
jgi:hypothetical protein